MSSSPHRKLNTDTAKRRRSSGIRAAVRVLRFYNPKRWQVSQHSAMIYWGLLCKWSHICYMILTWNMISSHFVIIVICKITIQKSLRTACLLCPVRGSSVGRSREKPSATLGECIHAATLTALLGQRGPGNLVLMFDCFSIPVINHGSLILLDF